ncbi:MAG TPA: substrate-binding domain-containing protein, partial [Candidatus Sulfomarinibacteraceae bacterium]|nr:substrate-binding domain-containing protein [Candidatus Sulfomarinibacteraceae bacterium]
QVRRSGIPFVVVDSTALPDEPGVEVDDEGGARAAARHLVELGHRAFLVIGIEPPSAAATMEPDGVTAKRLNGFRAVLSAVGVELTEGDIVFGPASMEGGIDAFRRAWAAGARPTAVLAMSDAMAIGAMRAARELGLGIPADLSIVGFDDVDVARYTDPPLTTVHQPIRRKGEEAVRLLLGGGRLRDGGPTEQERLETRLVVRNSTARAPHGREEVVDDGR